MSLPDARTTNAPAIRTYGAMSRYDDLPACLSQYYTAHEYAWLPASVKATLQDRELEPEYVE